MKYLEIKDQKNGRRVKRNSQDSSLLKQFRQEIITIMVKQAIYRGSVGKGQDLVLRVAQSEKAQGGTLRGY